MKAEDWIKVEDRLPEVNEDVLLAFILHREATEHFVTIGYLERELVKGLPTLSWNTEYEDKDMIITHWMPIVLPKEDNYESKS